MNSYYLGFKSFFNNFLILFYYFPLIFLNGSLKFDQNYIVNDGDIVAIFPPLGGG